MYDFNVFENARQQYAVPSLPFLDAQRKQALTEKPWQGLKILHNVPLTLATLFKIEVLALGGAEITATSIKILPPEKRAIDLLRQARFKVQLEHQFDEEFDFHLDCCGELLVLPPPRLGAVELTQTGSKLYQNSVLDYPVVSVDDSRLKLLETFFGTGDGFFRALSQHYQDEEIRNKAFVIFGHGKVGRGIIYALRKITNNITVIDIDINPATCIPGVTYIDANDYHRVKQTISSSWCAITATGINGLISNFYKLTKKDFGSCFLTNMGADDEYGDNFSLNDVAFNKKPFNFSLDYPTALHYLDPVFYAHNMSIDLILSGKTAKGYNVFPDALAQIILEKWQFTHNENIDNTLGC